MALYFKYQFGNLVPLEILRKSMAFLQISVTKTRSSPVSLPFEFLKLIK